MIIRGRVLPLVVLMASFAATAAGAETGLFGGVNFPTGDFNSGAKTGWNVGGYHTVEMLPILDVGLTGGYIDFGSDASSSSSHVWELQGLGQLKVLFLKGYLGVGIANYRPWNEGRKTKLAWQMGVSARISKLEGRLGYHQIPGDNGSVNWMSLTAGLVF